MENKKITFFDEKENVYKYLDLNIFIIYCIQNNLFLQDKKLLEVLLFNKLKINEEDKKLILEEFSKERQKIEDYLINNKEDKKYLDILYNYLYYLHFSFLNRSQKIFILNALKVDTKIHQKIFSDFTINEKSSTKR